MPGLDQSLIAPVKMRALKVWVAKRPRDSSSSAVKAEHELIESLLDVREGLHRMRRGYADRAP